MTQYTDLWKEEKIETLNSELDERNREIAELQKALETAYSKLEMCGQVPKTQNLISNNNSSSSNSNEHTDPPQPANSIKSKIDSSPTPVNSKTPETRLVIQVGDKHFTTTQETLTSKSTFFSTFFSGHDVEKMKKQSDGSYFIDADGNLFTHILAYLRRGTLPLFFNTSTGHDHALYNSLLTEAKYFEIPQLIQYLSTQQYLKAVRVVASIDEEEEEENGRGLVEVQGRDGIEMIDVFPTWQKKMVYVCPRDIEVHRGNPSACGRQCRNAQVGEERRFDEDLVLRVAIVKKRVVVDGEALRG